MIDFDLLPYPSSKRIAIHIKPAAERALRSGHPWLFDQAIRKQNQAGDPGDLAVIFDSKGRFLAVGLYDPDSPIRVKILQHGQQATINQSWFDERLRAALERRLSLVAENTNGYRLVHGENDGLPGLVIDRYADVLVMKLYTIAWLPHLRDIIPVLQTAQPFDRLVLRLSRSLETAMKQYGLTDGQILIGDDLVAPTIFQENGLHFAADVIHGHKTGFFFDQRDNRAQVSQLSAGRRVLDVFAYSGGFSVYAASGGAQSVTSLDVSAPALEAAAANFALNHDHARLAAAQHSILVQDAFDGLQNLRQARKTFDMLIVDPPSFAKSAAEIEGALAAYARLTHLALDILESGGVFVMASCSSRVTPENFFSTITGAAKDHGRRLFNTRYNGHALDHPIGFPEGEYLKCLFAVVD